MMDYSQVNYRHRITGEKWIALARVKKKNSSDNWFSFYYLFVIERNFKKIKGPLSRSERKRRIVIEAERFNILSKLRAW